MYVFNLFIDFFWWEVDLFEGILNFGVIVNNIFVDFFGNLIILLFRKIW